MPRDTPLTTDTRHDRRLIVVKYPRACFVTTGANIAADCIASISSVITLQLSTWQHTSKAVPPPCIILARKVHSLSPRPRWGYRGDLNRDLGISALVIMRKKTTTTGTAQSCANRRYKKSSSMVSKIDNLDSMGPFAGIFCRRPFGQRFPSCNSQFVGNLATTPVISSSA